MNRSFVIEIHFFYSLSEKQKQFEKELAEVNDPILSQLLVNQETIALSFD